MKNILGAVLVSFLAVLSGCSATVQGQESSMPVSNTLPAAKAEVEEACKGQGGDCVTEGFKDLASRSYRVAKDTAVDTYNDEENQKAVRDSWEWIKEKAQEGYDAAKEAVE